MLITKFTLSTLVVILATSTGFAQTNKLSLKFSLFSKQGMTPLLGTLAIAAGDINGDNTSEIISAGEHLKDNLYVYLWSKDRVDYLWKSEKIGILNAITTLNLDNDAEEEILLHSYIGSKANIQERDSLVIIDYASGKFNVKSYLIPTATDPDCLTEGNFRKEKESEIIFDVERHAHEETILDNLMFFRYTKDNFEHLPVKIELPYNAVSMFVKDVNGDGLDDIWVLGDNSQFQVYGWSKEKKGFLLLRDMRLLVEDTLVDKMVHLSVQGNGHMLFLRNDEVYELTLPRSDKEPVAMELLTKLPLNIVRSAVVGDIDGDGNQELLVSASGKGAGFFIYEYVGQ